MFCLFIQCEKCVFVAKIYVENSTNKKTSMNEHHERFMCMVFLFLSKTDIKMCTVFVIIELNIDFDSGFV